MRRVGSWGLITAVSRVKEKTPVRHGMNQHKSLNYGSGILEVVLIVTHFTDKQKKGGRPRCPLQPRQ